MKELEMSRKIIVFLEINLWAWKKGAISEKH